MTITTDMDPFTATDEDQFGEDETTGHDEGQHEAGESGQTHAPDEADEQEPASSGESGETGAGRRRKRTGPDKHLIRRSAAKSIELTQADPVDTSLLATLLGTGTDPVDLAVAVMTSSRSATTVLSDVRDLAISDPAERAVTVLTMTRARMKSIWQVLAALDVVPVTMPTADAKAALALSGADISESVLGHIDAVASLARKG